MPIDTQKATEQAEFYSYARDNGHLNFITKADKCSHFFAGEQWAETLKNRLERQGKPALTINIIIATMASVMGEQLENRADISFRPMGGGNQDVADALTKTYLQIANNNKLSWLESEVFDNGIIMSRGFYDARMGFDDHMRGEVKITRPNPRNVVLDPDAETYDPEGWKRCFLTKWLTATDVELLYGKAEANHLRARSRSNFMYGQDFIDRPGIFSGGRRVGDINQQALQYYRAIEHQYKRLRRVKHFVDPVTGDMRPIPENWDHNRIAEVVRQAQVLVLDRQMEQIRWTVTADDIVLFDEWSPYPRFTLVPFFPFFHDGATIGLVESLLDPQEYLNKLNSQELHIINTTANSGWKVRAGSLVNMDAEDLEDRGAETGLVLELNDVKDAEKIEPNQVPTGFDRMSSKTHEYIKQISGISDSTRGFDRADVAAKAIKAKQAAGSINISKVFDNLTRSRHMLARNVLDLVQRFYTEERLIQITGDFRTDAEELTVNQVTPEGTIANDLTLGEYEVVVTTVPARSTFEESQFQQAVQLRELGIPVPDSVLIENSMLAKKAEILKLLEGNSNEQEQAQAQLDAEVQRVEMAVKAADARLKQANAELSIAKAEKERLELQNPNGEKQAELEIKRREMEAKLAMTREQNEAKLNLEREKMRLEHLREMAVNAEKLDIEKEKAQHQAEQAKVKAQQQSKQGGKGDAKASR